MKCWAIKTAQTTTIEIEEAVIDFVEQVYDLFFGCTEKLLCERVDVFNRVFQVVRQRDL